jgi:hypothetical protein
MLIGKTELLLRMSAATPPEERLVITPCLGDFTDGKPAVDCHLDAEFVSPLTKRLPNSLRCLNWRSAITLANLWYQTVNRCVWARGRLSWVEHLKSIVFHET